LLLLLPLAAGCATHGTVTGKVLHRGTPLDTGGVVFLAKDGHTYNGNIEKDGSYTVPKIPPGLAKIAVVVASGPSGQPMKIPPGAGKTPEGIQGGSSPGAMTHQGPKIAEQYSDPEKSGLTYEVKSGSQEHDIDIP
jgi:hypothetical protein